MGALISSPYDERREASRHGKKLVSRLSDTQRLSSTDLGDLIRDSERSESVSETKSSSERRRWTLRTMAFRFICYRGTAALDALGGRLIANESPASPLFLSALPTSSRQQPASFVQPHPSDRCNAPFSRYSPTAATPHTHPPKNISAATPCMRQSNPSPCRCRRGGIVHHVPRPS
ncbi:hypothetical protein XA68_14817 [Ophiocordyceps unilateralis]|uniref:Uncharacterized protein n=1 Tax=Ophiocordyceps unilateralis TaxID=268505 RepID=A0A2A9PLA6_OPHUN|nr:hypothetical protein XA68_14817 [Ophiocordyceps unilateralis]